MSRFTNPVPQFFLDDGSVASFGRMYFYENNNFAVFKNTYSQPDNTVENTIPVKLTGSGRLPACFGEGLYSVKFYSANPENPDEDGTLLWTRNDVSLSELTGQFELWNAAETYTINDIVKDPSDGNYYQLYGALTSKGEQPSASLIKWEIVYFLTGFNPNKTYDEDQIVVSGGFIYRSLENGNEDTPPSAKWANLTFNDSIAGNFSVGGNLVAEGTAFIGGNVLANSGKIIIGSGVNTYLNNIGQISNDDLVYEDIATIGGNLIAFIGTELVNVTNTPKFNSGKIQIGTDAGVKRFINFEGKISSDDVTYKDIATVDDLGVSNSVAAGGDLVGNIYYGKVGKIVTITTGFLTHGNQASPQSAAVIPAGYRPDNNVSNVYLYSGVGNIVASYTITTAGEVLFTYRTTAGADVNRVNIAAAVTISYILS